MRAISVTVHVMQAISVTVHVMQAISITVHDAVQVAQHLDMGVAIHIIAMTEIVSTLNRWRVAPCCGRRGRTMTVRGGVQAANRSARFKLTGHGAGREAPLEQLQSIVVHQTLSTEGWLPPHPSTSSGSDSITNFWKSERASTATAAARGAVAVNPLSDCRSLCGCQPGAEWHGSSQSQRQALRPTGADSESDRPNQIIVVIQPDLAVVRSTVALGCQPLIPPYQPATSGAGSQVEAAAAAGVRGGVGGDRSGGGGGGP